MKFGMIPFDRSALGNCRIGLLRWIVRPGVQNGVIRHPTAARREPALKQIQPFFIHGALFVIAF
jgi:hypothetical protein